MLSLLYQIPLDIVLAQQSMELAAKQRVRGSDAVDAAVAQRYSCPLITLIVNSTTG